MQVLPAQAEPSAQEVRQACSEPRIRIPDRAHRAKCLLRRNAASEAESVRPAVWDVRARTWGRCSRSDEQAAEHACFWRIPRKEVRQVWIPSRENWNLSAYFAWKRPPVSEVPAGGRKCLRKSIRRGQPGREPRQQAAGWKGFCAGALNPPHCPAYGRTFVRTARKHSCGCSLRFALPGVSSFPARCLMPLNWAGSLSYLEDPI